MISIFTIPLFFGVFSDRLNEGGPAFTYPSLFILLVCISLSIYAFIKGDPTGKWKEILKSLSLFALVWGFAGFLFGMIDALDTISNFNGDIATPVLAGGLKVGLLSPLFGAITFIIARIGILTLIFNKK